MEDKKIVIYEIGGISKKDIWLLIHIEDAEGTSDWETYQSAIIQVVDGQAYCRYFVDEWLTSIWVSDKANVFACSMSGIIHHNSSGKWEKLNLGKQYSLNDIWGFDDKNIFCCGLDGVLFHNMGDSFQLVKTGIKKDFQKIRGNSPKSLYVIGQAGSIIFFDGNKWFELDSPTNCFWMSILCKSENEIYVCGEHGSLYRGNQFEWNKIDDVEFDVWDLALFENQVFVASEESGLLKIQDQTLIPVFKDIKIAGMYVIEELLFTFYLDNIQVYDGKQWSLLEFDYNKIIFND